MRMLRALVAVLVVACGASKPAVIPTTPIEQVLPCVVSRVADQIRSSRSPRDELQMAVDVAPFPSTRSVATRYLDALSTQLPKDPRVSGPLVQARVALALVEIGAYDKAAELAEQALGAIAGVSADDRSEILLVAALAMPIASKEPPRLVLEGTDHIAKLYAVQGLARSGRKERAKTLLVSLPAPASRDVKGAHLLALAWIGDAEAGRALIAADPEEPMLPVWFAKALVDAKHGEARQTIDAGIERTAALAVNPPSWDELISTAAIWSELVRFREMLDRDTAREARTRLHDWLLSKDDGRRELLGINIVRATIADHGVEAARLEKALKVPLASMVRLELAAMRGDFAAALDALAAHQTERKSFDKLVAPDAPLLDAIGTAEVTLWLMMAAKPSVDPAVIERFRGLACPVQ